MEPTYTELQDELDRTKIELLNSERVREANGELALRWAADCDRLVDKLGEFRGKMLAYEEAFLEERQSRRLLERILEKQANPMIIVNPAWISERRADPLADVFETKSEGSPT